jgi:hypothetical protein
MKNITGQRLGARMNAGRRIRAALAGTAAGAALAASAFGGFSAAVCSSDPFESFKAVCTAAPFESFKASFGGRSS